MRRHDIDNLRALLVLLLLVFHTARLFDAEPWHVKDPAGSGVADLLIALMNQWHMPAFFLLAGMSAHYALESRGTRAFVRERLLRLGIPFVFGVLVVIPPQVYVERASIGLSGRSSPIDFTGSFLDFYPRFFDCCYPAANFSWHHLWFVIYLFVLSLVLLPVFLGLRHAKSPTASAAALLLLGLGPLLAELALRPSFRTTHDLIHDWTNLAHYGLLLVIGGYLAAQPALEAKAHALRWQATLAGVVLTLLWLGSRAMPDLVPLQGRIAFRIAGEWCWLVAFLGHARQHLARPTALLTPFARYAYPFYIFHQTVIVLAGYQLLGWAAPWWLKLGVIIAGSGVVTLGLCLLFDLSASTRLLVGLRGRPSWLSGGAVLTAPRSATGA
jgi:peptidoglycan/LPS O-acetylase OafA/YrhL